MIRYSIVALVCFVFSGCSLIKYTVEHAPYQLISEEGEYELRRYDGLVLVSTSMSAVDSSDDSAFLRLFDFISGENDKNADISMTAPVFMDEARNQNMSFVLPSQYSLETAPIPSDQSLSIEERSNFTAAVVRFSGRLDIETIQAQKKKLKTWIDQQNIEVIGDAFIAGYDPPSSIPWFRRNEVLIPVALN